MNKQRVRRVIYCVRLADVGLATIDDERVSAEVEQKSAVTVLSGHAQANAGAEGGAAAGSHHVSHTGN